LIGVGAPAVESLIASLKDADPNVRRDAASALGFIHIPRVVEPLIAALKDIDPGVRRSAAGALGRVEDPRSVAVLLTSWKDNDLTVIAGAYSFFIQRGEPGAEGTLIEALFAKGDSDMAEAFLNCGNAKLREAGVKWAEVHSYKIMSLPGGGGVRWGSRR
jgi:HEAT repeat protein